MEQRKQKKKRGRAAFTLVEFLAVTAIVSILAALSFVAVSRYQRQLRRMEMDQTAKEIFLAAQNHLTLEVSDGTIPRLLSMDARNAFSEEEKTSKLGIWAEHNVLEEDETSGTGDVYVVIYRPGMKDASAAENPTEEIRARLLPFGSVDETVRADGSYLILYEPEAGLVREVWYSDRYQFVAEDIGDQNLTDAAGAPRKREGFTGKNPDYSEQKLPIGFYAAGTGDEPGAQDKPGNSTVIKFQAPTVKLIDGDILYVEITDPNEKEHTLRLFVGGETSGTQGYLELNGSGSESSERVAKVSGSGSGNAGTYQVILDDISASRIPGRSLAFSSLNGTGQTALIREKGAGGTDSFIPGENIYVYAQVFNNETLSSVETSNTESGNSLFAAIDDEQSAVIESFRHLENLDTRVSGFVPENVYVQTALSDPQTVTAMQNRDLLWKVAGTDGDESGYCEGVADLHERFGKEGMNTDAETMAIAYREAEEEGTEEVLASAAGSYLPVHPSYVLDYQGNTHRIDGLQVGETGEKEVSAVEGAGGVFGTVTWDLEVHNLWLRQPVIRTERNAGAVIGEVTSGTDPAGNTVRPRVVLEQIQVEYPQVQAEGADASAGALIGHFEGDALTVSRVLAENHFRKKLGNRTLEKEDLAQKVECTYRIRSLKGTGGGLVGTSKGELHLQNSAAALYVEGKNAGGLIGIAEKAARTAKQGRSTPTVEIRNCYVGGHTVNETYDTSKHPGASAGANVAFDKLPGRYNVAAYTGGKAGGLAAQLPADSQVSYSYTVLSVYAPEAEKNDGTGTGDGKQATLAAAFIASYDTGAAGRLPSETQGGNGKTSDLYPGCYTSAMVNKESALLYPDTLSGLFLNGKLQTEEKKNAYPYDAKLKASPNYPMPTVQEVLDTVVGAGKTKTEEAEKLPWFLKTHVGDWEKEGEETSGLTANNGNRLYIEYVTDWTVSEKQEETPADGTSKWLYLTFSVTGEMSQKPVYYMLKLNAYDLSQSALEKAEYYCTTDFEDLMQSKTWGYKSWWHQIPNEPTRRFEFTTLPSGQVKVRFYLDNLSFYQANYGALSEPNELIPGEYADIKFAENAEKKEELKGDLRVNSCFYSVTPNAEEPGTYVAEIANSRHLQNLSFCKEQFNGLKISKAVQIDNILWQEDPEVSVDPKTGAEAYCKEISGAYGETTVHLPNYSGTPSAGDKGFLSIENEDLREYDGNHKTISKLKINAIGKGTTDDSPRGSALFQKTDDLTVKDLYIKDPEIAGGANSAAVLIAQAGSGFWENQVKQGAKLTLNNIYIYGDDLKVTGTSVSGGVVASAMVSELKMENVYVYGSDALVQGSYAGGLVGTVRTDEKMVLKNSFFSGYVELASQHGNDNYIGGLFGKLVVEQPNGPANADAEFQIEQCYVAGRNQRRKGEASERPRANICGDSEVGGLIGSGEGKLTIRESFSAADVYSSNQHGAVGVLIGAYQESSGLLLDTCYTAGMYSGVGEDSYRGYLIGRLDGVGSWEDAASKPIKCRFLNTAYLSREDIPGICSFKLIGAPARASLPSGIVDASWLLPDPNQESGLRAGMTESYDPALTGLNYPFKIWTTYQNQREYKGDWEFTVHG